MGGMLGFGGSSAKTDRGNQLAATQGEWNLFNYGLPTGQSSQSTGTADLTSAKALLGQPEKYWSDLLSGGRTTAAAYSAPAVNATLASETATRNAEGTLGTGRTGGTNSANREASSQAQSKIDDIINSTLQTGRQTGAAGLTGAAGETASIGGTELSNALSLLGLSQGSITSILNNATQSRGLSYDINRQSQQDWGQAIGQILLAEAGG